MAGIDGLLKTLGGLAATGVASFVALLAVLYRFQRNIIFPRPDGPPLPVTRGRLVEVDVSGEARPAGVPDRLVAVYFPPNSGGKVLAFWHGNADQIGNVADHLGHLFQRNRGYGFFGIEYPGYALCRGGEPTEETITWAAARCLRYLRDELGHPPEDTVAFGQSIGGAVALKMTHEGRAGACVLLSSFASLPLMARAIFPFVPAPELLVKDPFDCAALAPAVDRPVLVLHGTRDEIVPFSQGETVAKLLPKATFVPIPHAGHNDTFNGAAFRLVLDSLDAFLKKL